MTALTDRYVHATLRAAPSSQRAELEPEIRALVADTIDAHDGDERAALSTLGDPDALAARYGDGPRHLIGPALFPQWRRLLTVLLPILVPIIVAVVIGARLLGGGPIADAIADGISAGIGVAIQTLFWVTIVFAAIEWFGGTGAAAAKSPRAWTVDDLPELPDDGRIGIGELASTLVANVAVLVGILWVQLQSPIVMDGATFPLFDPALWSFWLPYFLVVTVLEIAFTLALFARGRWSMTYAIGNAALGAAFAIPAIWLLQNDLLFNPALVAEVTEATGGTWLDVTGIVIACVVVAVVIWDAIDGFLKARRAREARRVVRAA
jgi:hypothetical protein